MMYSVPEFKKKQIILVFAKDGDVFSFKNDNIVVKDKEGIIKHQSTCYNLFLLFIVGDTKITSGLLRRAKKFGFSICLMTYSFKVYQIINCIGEGNTILRKKQYSYVGMELGKHLIQNKINNQKEAIKKKRAKTQKDKLAINSLSLYAKKIKDAKDINEIMGIEGTSAKKYFGQIFNDISWQNRKPRVKSDYINSTLDIGYTLLFNFIEAIVTSFGFDIYQGILHRCFYMRKSLICDFVEPFRPIVDLGVKKSINLGVIKEDDFEIINNKYILKYKNNAKVVQTLLKPIIERKSDIFFFVQQYYRAFMKNLKVSDFPVFEL